MMVPLPPTTPACLSPVDSTRHPTKHKTQCVPASRPFSPQAVQRAAFVGELKGAMETRKHHKLYMAKARPSKAAAAAKTRNANPMRNRAAVGLKAKPMPATATTMVKVKGAWSSIFVLERGFGGCIGLGCFGLFEVASGAHGAGWCPHMEMKARVGEPMAAVVG